MNAALKQKSIRFIMAFLIKSVSVLLPWLPGMQSASFLRSVISSGAVCLAVPYFSTFSYKRRDFRKKLLKHIVCVLISTTLF
jgi:hypothetical protein